MVKIKSVNYITCDDVEELTGKHWGDFEFAQMAENDSYQYLCCSDDRLEDLYEDLKLEEDFESGLSVADFEDEEEYNWHKRHCCAARLKNEIQIVEILRKQYGIQDGILVWISW